MAWLTGWTYRKKVTISGSTGAGTNYQVLLKVGESSGATGCNFHVEGHSAIFPSGPNNSGDLRFTASDGVTLLDFWVETVTGTAPSRIAYCWVEVSADLGTDQDVYCYYGNSAASNISNGPATFPFFEDFNAYTDGDLNGQGGWSGDTRFDVQGTTVYEGAKAATVSGGPANTLITVQKAFTCPSNSIEIRVYLRAAQTNLSTGYIGALNSAGGCVIRQALTTAAYFQVQGATSANDGTYAANTWYLTRVQIRETDQYGRVAGGEAAFSNWVAPWYTGTPSYIQLGSYSLNAVAYWDLIVVRKFRTTEPAFSSAGSEQTAYYERTVGFIIG